MSDSNMLKLRFILPSKTSKEGELKSHSLQPSCQLSNHGRLFMSDANEFYPKTTNIYGTFNSNSQHYNINKEQMTRSQTPTRDRLGETMLKYQLLPRI